MLLLSMYTRYTHLFRQFVWDDESLHWICVWYHNHVTSVTIQCVTSTKRKKHVHPTDGVCSHMSSWNAHPTYQGWSVNFQHHKLKPQSWDNHEVFVLPSECQALNSSRAFDNLMICDHEEWQWVYDAHDFTFTRSSCSYSTTSLSFSDVCM